MKSKFTFDRIICGDVLDVLKTIPDASIDCCITSPPYFAQRNYQVEGQLGLEPTISEYLAKLLQVFTEVKRVLTDTGTCWINLSTKIQDGHDLMIPERFALGMIKASWIKKRTKIWWKPNAFCRNLYNDMRLDFEYFYFFVKTDNYYFEPQYIPHIGKDLGGGIIQYPYRKMYTNRHKKGYISKDAKEAGAFSWTPRERHYNPKGRQKGSVWAIKSHQFRGGHFSSFPEALIEIPVSAGCPEDGVILDPFIGSGTTAIVALKNRRHWIGIDINPDYVKIANHRMKQVQLELF